MAHAVVIRGYAKEALRFRVSTELIERITSWEKIFGLTRVNPMVSSYGTPGLRVEK